MSQTSSSIRFKARLLQPARAARGSSWSFLVLPKSASARLPRRGMTTVEGRINGHRFRATLEPDGQLSHWLRVGRKMREAAGANVGDTVTLEIAPVEPEPDPRVPENLRRALDANPEARATWLDTTSLARLDWIHWITSAKRAKTRAKRIDDACNMLASGKRRVCCFDPSGFYSKGFGAPEAADQTESGASRRRFRKSFKRLSRRGTARPRTSGFH